MSTQTMEKPPSKEAQNRSALALLGGEKTVASAPDDMFTWPIITQEDEDAVLGVLRRGAMSGIDVTQQFEKEVAAWQGSEYALGFNNGTAALLAAMFAVGVGAGDEIICPAITYWASAMPAFSLGATIVFADIHARTLCLDPADIERHISPRTKAIVVVHYLGHPCDMDAICEIARRHNLKIIEDVSHAQGGLYKNRKLGTFGDAAAMSLMSVKSLAAGEAGMLVTSELEIYERAVAFGHYERFQSGQIESEDLKPFTGLPLGGFKDRMHQLSSAMGRVQLKHYDARCVEIRRAMNYFWDLLEGVPGVRAHRVDEGEGSNMGGWFNPAGHYVSEELSGLSVARFCHAVREEGSQSHPGGNLPLHRHPVFNDCDIYHHGKPTRIAHSERDLRQPQGSLPVSENINNCIFAIPWFKHFRPELIEQHANAYRKVAENHRELLAGDSATSQAGRSGLSPR